MKLKPQKNIRNLIPFLLGSIFAISTVVIWVNPAPFLRFGYPGVFLFSLIWSGTPLVPLLAQHMNIVLLAFVAALGMAINDSVTWYVGKTGRSLLPPGKKILAMKQQIEKYGVIALFFWALIPFPYDITAFIAGYIDMTFYDFFLPTFAGRFIRFILIGSGVVALLGKA